ncbi:cytochrome c3 family protein [Thermodesulfobacteriota bacterium]
MRLNNPQNGQFYMILLIFVLVTIVSCVKAPHQGVLTFDGESIGCLSGGCHSAFSRKKVVHKPITDGKCGACHKIISGKKEGETGPDYELSFSGISLCTSCHSGEKYNKKKLHAHSVKDLCLVCHNPHSSDFPGILRAEENKLCVKCHRTGSDHKQP